MFNMARVGVVVALAALGCGGKASEAGNATADGNTPARAGAGSDTIMTGGAAAGGPGSGSTYLGPNPGAARAPASGSYSVLGSGGWTGDAGGASYAVAGSGGLTGDAGAANYSVGGSGGFTGDAGGVNYSIGGRGGFTGDAGGVGVGDCSTPALSPPLAVWQAPTPTDEPVSQLLDEARSRLTGNWRGVVTTPFVPPYSIVMSFGADGGYSAHCSAHSDYDSSSPGCCRALYYGTDQDSALKRWTLATADAAGSTSGLIDIIFGYSGMFWESADQGKISDLEFAAEGRRARFTLDDGDIVVGTVDLERTP